MSTKRETVIRALHTGLASLAPRVERGTALPERIPAEGIIILRDGEPGEPEVTMSPLAYHYEHTVDVEIIVQSGSDPHGAADTVAAAIGALIASDRTLGGLCDWVEPMAPKSVELPIEGAAVVKAVLIPVVVHYTTSDPLD